MNPAPCHRLSGAAAATPAAVQAAIDALAAAGGGTLELPPGVLELDRALHLRSGVHLTGAGAATILRKGPGRAWPLSGYHNYGMRDVPLQATDGLAPGMTVSVLDDARRGFYSTFATITWVADGWVGLDRGLCADLLADANPVLTSAHPLLCGHRVRDVTVSNLTLDGNLAANPITMDACRGAAVYLCQSHHCTFRELREHGFNGEGLGYQMCHHIDAIDCTFTGNTGNGFHPGAGSTNTRFLRCTGTGNEQAGFFFCVRANHITVGDCTFADNRLGVSIGTRDCHNRIESCTIRGNREAGIHARACAEPAHVHSVQIADCTLADNGGAQLHLEAAASRIRIERNRIAGAHPIRIEPGVSAICLRDNQLDGAVEAPADACVDELELGPVGFRHDLPAHAWRHLDTV